VRFVFRRPRRAELARWVSAVWWCTDATASQSVLPAGRAQLVVPVGDRTEGVLHGPASRPRLVEPVPPEAMVGVVFRAGGTRPFFAPPADMLADRAVALSELWCRDALRLLVGVQAQPALQLDQVEAVLASRVNRTATGSTPLVAQVLREFHRGSRVATIAARCGVDRRALSNVFRREVGFGLKRYARLMRFERAVRAIRAADAPSLSAIAAELSFADQAHLTREFVSFAGLTPGRLHRKPGPSALHVVHDEIFKTVPV
jgi:AraC-like DNA-binding protein